jgi:outer membrane protein assembly factor BamD (BamD/ComL family)
MLAWHGQWRWLATIALCIALPGCEKPPQADTKTLLEQGWEQFRAGEFSAAIAAFEAVAKNASDPSHRPRALYGLATTWAMRRPGEDLPRAQQLFEQLIREYPTSDLAAWSMLAIARMKHLSAAPPIDRSDISQSYQRVIDSLPSQPAADEAFLYQQSLAVTSLDPDQTRNALAALRKFIADRPSAPFVAHAWGLVAECCRTLDDAPGQLAARIKGFEAREVDPLNPLSDNSGTYWNIATCAEFDVGDFGTARRFYGLLMQEYPNDQRVYGAELALKRMDDMQRRAREAQP